MSGDQQPSPISPADRPNLDVMPAAEEMDDGDDAEADRDVEAEVEAEEAPEQEVVDQGRGGQIEVYLLLTMTTMLNLARKNQKCRSAPHALGSLRLLSV